MATPPIVTQYAGPTPYKLTNVETNINVFNSDFNPNQISNLAIWLDGRDVFNNGSNNPADGVKMNYWANKAPNGITVTQTNELYRPNYGSYNLGVYFDNNNTGSSGNINGYNTTYTSANNNETIFILLKYATNNSVNYNLLYPSIADGGRQLSLESNAPTSFLLNTAILTGGGSTRELKVGSVTSYTNTLVSSWNDSIELRHYINGGLAGSTPPTTPFIGNANTLIGTDNYAGNEGLYGYISEIIIYSNALSDNDRQKVESYLYWKWLEFDLDNENPYKTKPYPNINSNVIPPVPRNLFSGLPTLDSNNYPLIKNFIQLPNRLRNVMF